MGHGYWRVQNPPTNRCTPLGLSDDHSRFFLPIRGSPRTCRSRHYRNRNCRKAHASRSVPPKKPRAIAFRRWISRPRGRPSVRKCGQNGDMVRDLTSHPSWGHFSLHRTRITSFSQILAGLCVPRFPQAQSIPPLKHPHQPGAFFSPRSNRLFPFFPSRELDVLGALGTLPRTRVAPS